MDINPLDIIIHIINIIVLFLIVKILVYKPVRKFMSVRKAKIDEQLTQAETRESQALSLKAEYTEKLSQAEESANEKVAQIIENAHSDAKTIVDSANADAQSLMASAKAKTKLECENQYQQMREQIADVSVEIAGKILEREITKEDNETIIDNFFKKADV